MKTSFRYIILAAFPLGFSTIVLFWPHSDVRSARDFYALTGWTYVCGMLWLVLDRVIVAMIQKLGEKLALASVSLAMIGFILYWQLGGREHLAAIFPGRSPSASSDVPPFIALFGAWLGRFIAETKKPNKPPEATPGQRPPAMPSPSSGAPQLETFGKSRKSQ